MTKVKWLELQFDQEDIDPIIRLLKSGDSICGFSELVEEFEDKAIKFIGAKFAIACASGTVALMVACMALQKLIDRRIKFGVPTWSYIAPANVADFISDLVLLDSNKFTHNVLINDKMDIDVIIPVDMAGVPADYGAIKKLGIPVIADAAESFGSEYNNIKVGNLAEITITSFQEAKIITTGEGGMIFTENKEINELCRLIINQGYGPSGYDTHDHIAKGFNFRMTGIQAALGISQLKKLPDILNKRAEKASIYNKYFKGKIELHGIPDDVKSNYYSYLVMFSSKKIRDKVKEYLWESNIECKLWKPIHLYNIYNQYGPFDNAEYIYDHHLRLPIHNNLSNETIEFVAEKLLRGLEIFSN